MGKFFDTIRDIELEFIKKQKMFFVATSPLSGDGHINLSPKGLDSFRVVSPDTVMYLDITGSGNETSAHILENGRITFMFCAFDGPPNILRLYGKGQTILPTDDRWAELVTNFGELPGARQIILADIYKVQTSCGYSVPLYNYVAERDHAYKWVKNKGDDGLKHYREEKNQLSLDNLPTHLSLKSGTTDQ